MRISLPVRLGISGYKKSGKSSLIESLVRSLTNQGIRIGVIKHQNEPVQPDQPGSDTDRFSQAGATVIGYDGQKIFIKSLLGHMLVETSAHFFPPAPADSQQTDQILGELIERLGEMQDVILVEGFKRSSLPKIWLLREGEEEPQSDILNIVQVLKWRDDRESIVLQLVGRLLKETNREE